MYMCHIIIFFTYFCSEAVIFFSSSFFFKSLFLSLSRSFPRDLVTGAGIQCVFTKVEWLCLASSTAVATLRGVTVIP